MGCLKEGRKNKCFSRPIPASDAFGEEEKKVP
jgi:hypothetical protein